ncbi:hypothetical protein [Spiroplasma culicicola]|uniref:Uncharacterized protein n=1 Tax=Spiroplasma culicicola AES-1 TaxID=1276246 RepID=W6AFB2_9MOLU|nr:hypothetical protein [Spiroplasma culicicola]AHI52369.1 hypothetical protein SCULI_v1c00280 [Spiroplasma culicicola AES-1]
MNCYIRLNNGNYEVVDGNTNKTIATFVSEFDAHKFLQSYLNSVYGAQPPIQPQQFVPMPMYSVPMVSYGMPMMMPQSGYAPQQAYGQPGMPTNYGQPNNGMMMQQGNNMAQQPQQNNGYPIAGMGNGQFNNSSAGYQQYPQDDSNNGHKKQGVDIFDDTTLTFDMSAFDEDKIGAIIQDNSLMINNTDDDSLGEVSLYSKKDKLQGEKKSKKIEDETLVNVSFRKEDDLYNIDRLQLKKAEAQMDVIDDYDLDNMSSIVVSESPNEDVWAQNIKQTSDVNKHNKQNSHFEKEKNSNSALDINSKVQPLNENVKVETNESQNRYNEEPNNASITSLYEKNLIPDDIVVPKKDDNLIDLGPVEEDDEVFSTPRRDAEQDDFENFSLSKGDKKALKKRKKAEEASRKKYSKLLK